MDCIFCKIANGEIPSKVLYEDDIVLVIMDGVGRGDGGTVHLLQRELINTYHNPPFGRGLDMPCWL